MSVVRATPKRISAARQFEEGAVNPSYEFSYLVETSSERDDERVVELHFLRRDLPYPGKMILLPWMASAVVVRSWKADRIGAKTWTVSGTADLPEGAQEQQGPQPPQPDVWETGIEITFEPLVEPIRMARFHGFYRDMDMKQGPIFPSFLRDGQQAPIMNSAGVVLDDPPQRQRFITVLRLSYASREIRMRDSGHEPVVNSAPFTISWPHFRFELRVTDRWKALLKHMGARWTKKQFSAAWDVQAELHIRDDTWAIWILDQGYEELSDSLAGGNDQTQGRIETTRIKTKSGNAITPRLLDGQGRALKIPPRSAVSAFYGLWMPYKEVDFRTILPR